MASTDDIFSDPVDLGINPEIFFETDEVKAARFVTLIDSCKSGSEVYKGLFTLSNTGTNHGFAIVMNRAIKLLIQHSKIAVDSFGNTTFAKLKKMGRDNEIEFAFAKKISRRRLTSPLG